MTETHRCKSRDNSPLGDRCFPGPDTWRVLPNGDRTCSFCGSLHPVDFLRLVKEAIDPNTETRIEPSDKAYKIYVKQAKVKNALEGGIKFYTWHLPEDHETSLRPLWGDALTASSKKFQKVLEDIKRTGRLE